MAHNFTRPQLPYDNQSLANDDRYRVLTEALNAPPTDVMLDSDFNAVIDYLNILDNDIQGVAAGIIPGADDPNNADFFPTTDGDGNISWVPVTDANCQTRSINANKLIDSSLTAQQIQNGTITSNKMAPASVGTTNIIDLNVTTSKIANGAVTATQIADNTITTTQMGLNSVGTTNIIDLNVTTPKIADGAVTATQIADNTITAAQIANNTITATQIANHTITAAQIVDNTITAAQIANNTITATQIAPSVSALKADQIASVSTTVYTNPAVQQFHPSAAKFWCAFPGVFGGTIAPTAGYNVASVTFNSDGDYTITFSVPFTGANSYITIPSSSLENGFLTSACVRTQTTTNVGVATFGTNGSLANPDSIYVVGYGAQ